MVLCLKLVGITFWAFPIRIDVTVIVEEKSWAHCFASVLGSVLITIC